MFGVNRHRGLSSEREPSSGRALPTYALALFLTITGVELTGCGGSQTTIDPVKMAQYREDFVRLESEREDLLTKIQAAVETGSTGTLRSEIQIYNIQVQELQRHLQYSASGDMNPSSLEPIQLTDYPEVFGVQE